MSSKVVGGHESPNSDVHFGSPKIQNWQLVRFSFLTVRFLLQSSLDRLQGGLGRLLLCLGAGLISEGVPLHVGCPKGPIRLCWGPPNGLLFRALEELVRVLHWRVRGSVMTLRVGSRSTSLEVNSICQQGKLPHALQGSFFTGNHRKTRETAGV